MNSNLKAALCGLVLTGMFACSDNNKDQDLAPEGATTGAQVDTTPVTVNDTTKFKFDFAIANIPSPATSLQNYSALGVNYDNSILNVPGKATKYSTDYMKSLNLGIYNIDMAYAMVNDRGQDMLQYLKSVMQLSEALGLKNAVTGMIGKRAENNLNNKDSLFRILDEIFVRSDSYLRTNERVYTAACVFTGSWLESLYINCKLGEKATDAAAKANIRKELWEQRFHLSNLTKLLADYKDKQECAELMKDLQSIQNEISACKSPEEMSDEKFNSISSKIIKLRDKTVA